MLVISSFLLPNSLQRACAGLPKNLSSQTPCNCLTCKGRKPSILIAQKQMILERPRASLRGAVWSALRS
jgi:hypothetical protein